MAIRKFIEEIGEKVLPARRNAFPVAPQQQAQGSWQRQMGSSSPQPDKHWFIGGVDVTESGNAIRRYLQTRREFEAPSDLVVFFNEMDAVVILGGTVRDAQTREMMIEAAGNIHGVERVDDRTTLVLPPP